MSKPAAHKQLNTECALFRSQSSQKATIEFRLTGPSYY